MKLILLTLLLYFSQFAFSASQEIHLIEIKGSIDPGSSSFFLESIEAAKNSNLLIVRLDTPGGLLSATREIIQGIANSPVPILIYVSPSGASATSAGALISLAAHISAMAPGTNIGAAHPVGSSG
jgi:membrane-bound serine protease (ClpP class)